MSAEKTLSTCPVCNTVSLVDHCTSGQCAWHKCRNAKCDAMLDLGKRRGNAISVDGKTRRNVDLGASA